MTTQQPNEPFKTAQSAETQSEQTEQNPLPAPTETPATSAENVTTTPPQTAAERLTEAATAFFDAEQPAQPSAEQSEQPTEPSAQLAQSTQPTYAQTAQTEASAQSDEPSPASAADQPPQIDSYDQLKEIFDLVDDKYRRTVNPVEIDLPDTLGLEKLSYDRPSDEQLLAAAQESFAAKYDSKKLSARQSAEIKRQDLSARLAEIGSSITSAENSARNGFYKAEGAALEKAAKNGTLYSSQVADGKQSEESRLNEALSAASEKYRTQQGSLAEKMRLLQENLTEILADLEEQRQADVDEKFNKLISEADKQEQSVAKYNNTVDEKENNFQIKRARAIVYARLSEQRRAMEAARLTATLGLSGVEAMKAEEKVQYAEAYFSALPRDEAVRRFYADDTLAYHFGKYYQYMEEFVNSLPDHPAV